MKPQLLRTPTRVINFAQIMPLLEREPANVSLTTRPEQPVVALARSRAALAVPLRQGAPSLRTNLKPIPAETFRVLKTAGSISRAAGVAELATTGIANLRLPIGMPRFVNVATLRQMLGANGSETLLKREGDRWEITGDSLRVDLLDASVEFRLGSIQIFS